MRFEIDTSKIKVAGGEENVSHTIEELLAMNNLIPAHADAEVTKITETQLDDNDYDNKPSRGEAEGITEVQLGQDNPGESRILEVQLGEAGESDGGHRPEMWDKDNEEVRGHKNVSPLWHQIYRQEDDRKSTPMKKKIEAASVSVNTEGEESGVRSSFSPSLLPENENPRTLEYFIDIDERGEFRASVSDSEDVRRDKILFEIKGDQIFEDGFMKHKEDLHGLREYLIQLGIMDPNEELVAGNSLTKDTWS